MKRDADAALASRREVGSPAMPFPALFSNEGLSNLAGNSLADEPFSAQRNKKKKKKENEKKIPPRFFFFSLFQILLWECPVMNALNKPTDESRQLVLFLCLLSPKGICFILPYICLIIRAYLSPPLLYFRFFPNPSSSSSLTRIPPFPPNSYVYSPSPFHLSNHISPIAFSSYYHSFLAVPFMFWASSYVSYFRLFWFLLFFYFLEVKYPFLFLFYFIFVGPGQLDSHVLFGFNDAPKSTFGT